MCVIIIKPAGAKMPTKNELERAYRLNPDGCGFVSESRFYKGLSFTSFYKYLRKVPESEKCIIHFRYATNGSVKKANCHPFRCGDVYFAHNGVLSIRPEGDKTDSETAFQNILMPIIESYGLKSTETKKVVNAIIGGSKFAFMQGNEIVTFGAYTEYEGRYYSNTRHLIYI